MNNFMLTNQIIYMKGESCQKQAIKIGEEIENLKRWMTHTEIEAVIKSCTTKKRPGSDGFTIKHLKKN